jgi:hypothetical protein
MNKLAGGYLVQPCPNPVQDNQKPPCPTPYRGVEVVDKVVVTYLWTRFWLTHPPTTPLSSPPSGPAPGRSNPNLYGPGTSQSLRARHRRAWGPLMTGPQLPGLMVAGPVVILYSSS